MSLFKKLFFTILCLAISTAMAVASSEAPEDPNDQRLNTIAEYVLTSHILSPEEGKALSEELDRFFDDVEERDVLRQGSLSVVGKIVKDRGNLEFILTDLEKLAKDPYASQIGSIDDKAFEASWGELKELRSDLKKNRPKLKTKKKLTEKQYKDIVQKHINFLSDQKNVQTPYDVWTKVKQQTEVAFPAWDQKYKELVIQLNKSDNLDGALSKDETKFVKVFGRVKVLYHMMDGSLAW